MKKRFYAIVSKILILLFALGVESFCTGFSSETTEWPVLNSTGELVTEQPTMVLSNTRSTLAVPTYVTNIDGLWFIVDSYHNQIIYNERRSQDLAEWKVLTNDVMMPHSIAGDGCVLLVDDTENHRVLVFAKNEEGEYVNSQIFNNIGNRPHHTVYDPADNAFYVWSSMTGEMYVFRRNEGASLVYLSDIRTVSEDTDTASAVSLESLATPDASVCDAVKNDGFLTGTYIRSFYIDGDDIYFVSGIRENGTSTGIVVCDKHSFRVKEVIVVPDKLAGMISLRKDGGYYYMTISTDVHYDQSTATMIRTRDLHSLKSGDYEELYSKYFIGGGTPYNMTKIGDTLYLTENRLPGFNIWSYKLDENDVITDVTHLY